MVINESICAKDVMTTSIVLVQHDDPLSQIEHSFVEHNIGGAPVMKDGEMTGIVSRSDIVRMPVLLDSLDGYLADEMRGAPEEEKSRITPFRERFPALIAEEIMTTQVLTCSPSSPVSEVAALMCGHHVHRIVVVEDQVPIGMIESLDLIALIATKP